MAKKFLEKRYVILGKLVDDGCNVSYCPYATYFDGCFTGIARLMATHREATKLRGIE